VFSTDDLKGKVKQYWEGRPCGTNDASASEHSVEWFDEIEESRYTQEPFVHAFAQFTRWRGKKVLEVGCGAGTDFVQFARAGADLYGIDLTEKAVELTRKRLAMYGLSADVRVGDAEALPFDDNWFDLVYSWGVLHHTPDTEKAIAEVYRVLKPSGCLVIMLYHRRSVVVLRIYLKYGLRAGRPFRKIADILANHMESAGTKAYTFSEIRRMFGQFNNLVLEPVLTPYDTYRLPAWSRFWLPDAWGWFVVIRGCKPNLIG
jgi:ubiquinone/menaquinone biosynthesis C-methylase UbiE